METMDRVEKEQRPDALVKIVTAPAKGVQFGALPEQFVHRKPGANAVQRLVAHRRVRRGNNTNQIRHGDYTVSWCVAG